MDSCNNCETEHQFSQERGDRVIVFLENQECNHILTTCPNCGHVTRIYCNVDNAISAIQSGLSIVLHARAPLEIRLSKQRLDAETEQRDAELAKLESDYADE